MKTDQYFIKITSFIKRQMVAINHPKIDTTCGAWCHPYTTTIQWNSRNHWTTSVESLLHHYYRWTFTSFCFWTVKTWEHSTWGFLVQSNQWTFWINIKSNEQSYLILTFLVFRTTQTSDEKPPDYEVFWQLKLHTIQSENY
jgi:hypothetical protein